MERGLPLVFWSRKEQDYRLGKDEWPVDVMLGAQREHYANFLQPVRHVVRMTVRGAPHDPVCQSPILDEWVRQWPR
jgi:hypothetical protein